MGRRAGPRVVVACICAVATFAGTANASTAIARNGSAPRIRVGPPRDDGDGGNDREATLRAELQQRAGGSARFAIRDSSGAVTFVGASADHPLQGRSKDSLATIGRRFVDRYATLFGAKDSRSNLAELTTFNGRSATGGAVRFQQTFNGVPVMAGQIAVQIDADGAVVSANGETSAALDVDTVPSVAAADAADTAIALTSRNDGVAAAQLSASSPELWIYDPSLLGAVDAAGPRLVWKIDARSPLGEVDRLVLVDAHSGGRALDFSQREDALFRQVCDNQNVRGVSETCTAPNRSEGQAATFNPDVDLAYDLSGETYNFYMSRFGRDSLDGAGMQLKSTVRYCTPSGSTCPYKNAFWNGSQMVYGQGFAVADDVVGHELTHGVTEFTSGLYYYADAGAINESLSDVMGEFIDLKSTVSGADPSGDRWKIGEQLPGIGAIRNMKDPTLFSDPDKVTSTFFWGTRYDHNGVHFNSGVNNKAAYLITDGTVGEPGGVFNGQTITGLGIDKAAAIYYQVETTLLTPGSDYGDLFNYLPQACTNLIGAAPLSITTGDCQQVSKAVLATEMNLHPIVTGAYLPAPLCPSGVQNSIPFLDDMETTTGNWVSATTGNAAPWGYTTDSSSTGTRSIHAFDAGGPRGISALTGQVDVSVPSASSFLRFDHSFQTDGVGDSNSANEIMWDGGVVEFSTNGGTSWTDISTLAGTVNPYIRPISNAFAGNPSLQNELHGRPAFGITSPNYQTTRVSLGTLAGQNVRFRFRLATDNFPGPVDEFPGWFIDDVTVYSCGAAQAPGAPRNPSTGPGASSASVHWAAPWSDGGSPISSYVVTPYIGGVAQTPVASPGTGLSTTVTGLTNGTTYTFRVAATNALGTGLNQRSPIPSRQVLYRAFRTTSSPRRRTVPRW